MASPERPASSPVKRVPRPGGRFLRQSATGPASVRLDQIFRPTRDGTRWRCQRPSTAGLPCLRLFVERGCHLGPIQRNRDRTASCVAASDSTDRCRDVVAGRSAVFGRPGGSVLRAETRTPSVRGLNQPHFSHRIDTMERRFTPDQVDSVLSVCKTPAGLDHDLA